MKQEYATYYRGIRGNMTIDMEDMRMKRIIASDDLRDSKQKLLRSGNLYTFACIVLNMYEDICKEAEFDLHDAENNYRSRIDFNDGIYTLWGKNGVKYFFDCSMQFRGTKI